MIELRQRGLVGTVPIYLAVKEFPLDLFPDFEAAYARTGTVLGAYASGGVHAYSRKQTRVFGDLARDAEAELLQLERGAPIIRSRSINTSPSGAVIECNRGCWPLHGVELVFGEDPASSG